MVSAHTVLANSPRTDSLGNVLQFVPFVSMYLLLLARTIFLSLCIYCFTVGLCQLRLGVLPVNDSLHRYGACAIQRNCVFCVNAIENEEHLFACPCIMTFGRNFWTIRLKTQSRLHWKLFFLGKAEQICFDWPSLVSVRLGEERSLRGQTSFTI